MSFSDLMKQYGRGAAAPEAGPAEENGAVDTYFVTRPDNGTNMVFLPFADQILFDSYNLFTAKPGVTSLVAAMDLPEPEEVDFLGEFNELLKQAEEITARGETVPDDFFDDLYARSDPRTAAVSSSMQAVPSTGTAAGPTWISARTAFTCTASAGSAISRSRP